MSTIDQRLENLSPEQRALLEQRLREREQMKQNMKVLLTLQEGDRAKSVPIFCFHPLHGFSGYYMNLIQHLPKEVPVYAFQSPLLAGVSDPFDDITEMVTFYKQILSTVEPEGPYVLLGHSSGSYLAYETARQLKKAGEKVPLLVVIDETAPAVANENALASAMSDVDLTEVPQALAMFIWAAFQGYEKEVDNEAIGQLLVLPKAERLELAASILKKVGMLRPDEPSDIVSKIMTTTTFSNRADYRYKRHLLTNPVTDQYDGTLLLFRSTEDTAWPGYDVVQPPDTSECSQWDLFCSGPRMVYGVPKTNHVTIMAASRTKFIAQVVEQQMAQLRSKTLSTSRC